MQITAANAAAAYLDDRFSRRGHGPFHLTDLERARMRAIRRSHRNLLAPRLTDSG
jgi:hypothetical protein